MLRNQKEGRNHNRERGKEGEEGKGPTPAQGEPRVVGTGGFEPPTSWPPSKCATKLRHVPTGRNRQPNRFSASDESKFTRSGRLCQAAWDACNSGLFIEQNTRSKIRR